MGDELVFTVEGSKATPAALVSLPEVGLKERDDLQEWVLEHPAILGDDVMIVTFEFDRWWSSAGTPLDRLDVLGLDRSGRLVVAELKRDVAPDTVEMQAIKYAAMSSRFTPDDVAAQHAKFLSSRGQKTTTDEAAELLNDYTLAGALAPEELANPRIVLLASSFPPVVTATAVWLREVGVDITLMRFQAYRTDLQTLVTVSQLLPLRDVEEFTVAPRRASVTTTAEQLPVVDWTVDDFVRLAKVTANPTVLAILDLCSSQPDQPVALSVARETSGRSQPASRADLAGLTMIVKRRLGRRNWPFTADWAAGGEQQMYYRMAPEQAAMWIEAAASLGVSSSTAHDDLPPEVDPT